MTNSSSLDNQLQLRKVAILVASLDDTLAAQLLADLPAREAGAVRKLVFELGEIDPTEQQAVFAAFRQGLPAPSNTPPLILSKKQPAKRQDKPLRTRLEGVELDASLLARLDAEENFKAEENWAAQAAPTHQPSPKKCNWQTLSEADATTLVEILSAEQPQTIATVLAKLDTARAAELIGKLSPTLQAEVLERLADLDPADEQTLEVVASQLAQWIDTQSQRHKRMAAGRDLVQRILQETPHNQREVLLTRLGKRSPALAEELAGKSRAPQPQDDLQTAASLPQKERPTQSHTTNRWNKPLAVPAMPNTYSPPSRPELQASSAPSVPVNELVNKPVATDDPLSELERLDEQALLNALQNADRQTVMLALAGVSEPLMKRIVRDLPRRQAKQFRQQVRAIGPIRLSDMLSAQRELVRIGLTSTTN